MKTKIFKTLAVVACLIVGILLAFGVLVLSDIVLRKENVGRNFDWSLRNGDKFRISETTSIVVTAHHPFNLIKEGVPPKVSQPTYPSDFPQSGESYLVALLEPGLWEISGGGGTDDPILTKLVSAKDQQILLFRWVDTVIKPIMVVVAFCVFVIFCIVALFVPKMIKQAKPKGGRK